MKTSVLRAPLHSLFALTALFWFSSNRFAPKIVLNPEMIETPLADVCVLTPAAVNLTSLFPALVVAQSHKLDNVLDLSECSKKYKIN